MTAHNRIRELARDILGDLAILAGERVGPSGASWQDVAGTCETNLRVLADTLHDVRVGNSHIAGRFPIERPVVFPSVADLLHAELGFSPCPDCGEGEGESR